MIKYEEIKKSKAQIDALDNKEAYIQKVFEYYRQEGYPDHHYSEEEKVHELEKLRSINIDNIIRENVITQTMHGLGLCWSYHPHAKRIKNGNALSPMEVFEDDELLITAIRKRIKYGNNISDAMIRKAVRKYGGVGISNFRPTAAASIYKMFGGRVWDMCGGFGGRMLGAFISGNVSEYIATEPATKAYHGLLLMSYDLINNPMKINLYNQCAEDFIPDEESLDTCFTSPPYFNTEKYSEEPTQSYLRYPKYLEWLDGFMRKMMSNCYIGLKNNGVMILNVNKTTTAPALPEDTIRIAKEVGFTLEKEYQLMLSGRPHKAHQDNYKYEPIYVFRKSYE